MGCEGVSWVLMGSWSSASAHVPRPGGQGSSLPRGQGSSLPPGGGGPMQGTLREQGMSGRLNGGFELARIYPNFETFGGKRHIFGCF